jgi:hypothetical protein
MVLERNVVYSTVVTVVAFLPFHRHLRKYLPGTKLLFEKVIEMIIVFDYHSAAMEHQL